MSQQPRIAVYPGTFDPITNGHVYILKRSLKIFDRLVVALAVNVRKNTLFSLDERQELIRACTSGLENVHVSSFEGLTVDCLRRFGAEVVIRGLRAVSDFEYEYQMALMNRHLSPGLEIVFMVPSIDTTYISASLVREVARFGGDITTLVHPVVADAMRAKTAAK